MNGGGLALGPMRSQLPFEQPIRILFDLRMPKRVVANLDLILGEHLSEQLI
jgi:hypothetical protein